MSNESFKSSQNLRKAMEEAKRLAVMTPTPEPSPMQQRSSSMTAEPGTAVLELLRSLSFEEEDLKEREANQEMEDHESVKAGNQEQATNIKSSGHSNTEQQKGGFWALKNKSVANAVNSSIAQNKIETPPPPADQQDSSNMKTLPVR
jgi:hypothetical protein